MDKNKEEVPLRVALYLRVSTDDQAEKYGLNAQKSAIEGIIKSRGKLKDGRDAAVLAGAQYVYTDDGVSGTVEIDQRPAFTRLMEDVLNSPEGHRPFDVVAVYKIDRYARKLRILMDVLNFFEQNNVEFISATESIDTSTPFGRAMLGIMGVVAELERETIMERTQRGREQAILEGVYMGSHPPYGYQKDANGHLVILEEEAEVVRKIFTYFTVDKLSLQKIADILKQNEILSPDASAVKNKKRKGVSRKLNDPTFWRAETVRAILSDDTYTGIRYYNKSKKGKPLPKKDWKQSPFRHESIIYIHMFELAQQHLKDLSDRKALTEKKQKGTVYLLSGLLKCDHCRKLLDPVEPDMMSWTGGKDKISNSPIRYSYHYQCNRKNRKKFSVICPTVPIPAQPLEDYVIDFIKSLLKDPQAVYDYQKQLASNKLSTKRLESDKKQFERLLNALPKRRQSLRDQHEMGEIDTPTLQQKLAGLIDKEAEYSAKINEIDYQLSQITLSKGYEASLNLYAEKYSSSLEKIMDDKEQLYELIHMLVYQIVVYSRPVTEKDVIAGRKKEGQVIPNRVDIYLNLPQNLLQRLYAQKFVVKQDNL